MTPADRLTDAQKAVVAHATGPALVFAVAGAGKTTSMVHRIRRLVRERGVRPASILATSFSRGTVQDLEAALSNLGIGGVDTRTLHSLGYRLIRRAEQEGHLPPRTREQDASPAALATVLARRALSRLAQKRSIDTAELGIDADELADQVGAWKQQLAYPDLEGADLPAPARRRAVQAEHGNEDVLTLYRIYESIRNAEGWITFDDMLLEGWEVLHRVPEIRAAAQSAYRQVLVDEFQDVSRVQYRMLDVLTEPHRNYMAIGDDDQCIYEWRGADPSFILDFRATYDADEYLISNTFRSPLGPAALATAVIAENDNRREKRLHPTRPPGGDARLVAASGRRAEAARVADAIEAELGGSRSPGEVAVLVRTYGQTPFLERAFIERDRPYRIVGSVPFYRRREVQTLLHYLYWAVLERRRRRDGWFEDRRTAARYVDRFERIVKRPNRYVEHALLDRVRQTAVREQTSVLDALTAAVPDMHDRTAERVEDFLHAADALVGRLDRPAQDTLEWLLDVLDYRSYLREQSAVDEIGEARVRTAEALVGMAEGCASTPALLEQIVDLASRHADAEADSAVEIRSIHRAKGAEWPVVVVPGCNDGTLPQRRTRSEPAGGEAGDTPAGGASDAGASDIEEERRLLYVAVTRAVDRLVLTYDADDALSPFLADVDAAEVLEAARRVQDRLGADPAGLDDAALAGLCRAAARLDEAGLDLKRYLRRWWPADDARRQALRRRLDNARPSVADARQAVSAYRQARKAHREERRAERRREGRATQGEIERLREVVGQAPIPVQNEAPDTFFPDDARFAFAWTDDETAVAVRWNGERVGMLDPLGSPRLRPDTFFDLPWPALVGRFEGVSGGRSRLRVAIDWAASADRAGASAPEDDAVEDAPDPPPAVVRDLASPAFASGWNVLREALGDDINRLSTESAIAVQTS